MIRAVPQFGVKMPKQPARGWFPSPPQVETHLAQRFERHGQRGCYIIDLESGHEVQQRGRQLIKKTFYGKQAGRWMPRMHNVGQNGPLVALLES
jgi:hypothetical protein